MAVEGREAVLERLGELVKTGLTLNEGDVVIADHQISSYRTGFEVATQDLARLSQMDALVEHHTILFVNEENLLLLSGFLMGLRYRGKDTYAQHMLHTFGEDMLNHPDTQTAIELEKYLDKEGIVSEEFCTKW